MAVRGDPTAASLPGAFSNGVLNRDPCCSQWCSTAIKQNFEDHVANCFMASPKKGSSGLVSQVASCVASVHAVVAALDRAPDDAACAQSEKLLACFEVAREVRCI